MSVPGGDYEIEHAVEVAPLIVDADGWPAKAPPGLSATASGWIAQGVGGRPAQTPLAKPAQMAPHVVSSAISAAHMHVQTSTYPSILIDRKASSDLFIGSTWETPIVSTHVSAYCFVHRHRQVMILNCPNA